MTDEKLYLTEDGFQPILDSINSRLSKLEHQVALSTLFDGIVVSRLIDFTQSSYVTDVDILCGDVDRVKAFSGRRRCNLADSGTVNAYFGDSGYKDDGTNGQVMVEQPKFYYKVEPLVLEKNTQTNGKGYHIRKAIYSVSDYQLPGFKLHPAFKNEAGNEVDYIYIGAYEGCLQNGAAYITDDSSGSVSYKLSSIADAIPASGQNWQFKISNAETCAVNRGNGWHVETIKTIAMNQLLFMIEYGCNAQRKFEYGIAYAGNAGSTNCAAQTGSTRNLNNASGRASMSYNVSSGTSRSWYTAPNKTAISYRGVENPYGNIFKYAEGILMYGLGSAISEPYICDSFSYGSGSSIASGYTSAGFTCPSTGYITAFGYGSEDYDWLLLGSETINTTLESSVIGDQQFNQSISTGSVYSVRYGGYWNAANAVGMFYFVLTDPTGQSAPSSYHRNARVCYFPQ